MSNWSIISEAPFYEGNVIKVCVSIQIDTHTTVDGDSARCISCGKIEETNFFPTYFVCTAIDDDFKLPNNILRYIMAELFVIIVLINLKYITNWGLKYVWHHQVFVITEFVKTEFVINQFVVTEFVITELVVTELIITEFVITKFFITKWSL